jgi:hypothetical protein
MARIPGLAPILEHDPIQSNRIMIESATRKKPAFRKAQTKVEGRTPVEIVLYRPAGDTLSATGAHLQATPIFCRTASNPIS